jgi:hypothetical protein
MNPGIQALKLEDLQSLDELRAVLDTASAAGTQTIMLYDDRFLGAVVPPELAKEMFTRMVAEHWAGNPDAIFDLEARLRDETPEDWDD